MSAWGVGGPPETFKASVWGRWGGDRDSIGPNWHSKADANQCMERDADIKIKDVLQKGTENPLSTLLSKARHNP